MVHVGLAPVPIRAIAMRRIVGMQAAIRYSVPAGAPQGRPQGQPMLQRADQVVQLVKQLHK
jgi:hypothetical protein